MDIVHLLKAKAADNKAVGGVTLAFLGDSVTQGCFALYRSPDGTLGTFFDQMHVYHQYLKQILSVLYPSVPINIINAGISSNTAQDGLRRLERDVICHRPDLAVVCFGLNDANNGPEGIGAYEAALRAIFRSLHQVGIETVFMTPNMTASHISPQLQDPVLREAAGPVIAHQNDGTFDRYMDAARAVCAQESVPVCDVYRKWKQLAHCGVDTTELLSNQINHPIPSVHWLFAASLTETILQIP